MKQHNCSTDNHHNVNILSNNRFHNIRTSIKSGVDVIVKGVQFIFHCVKYKLKRYKSLRDLYLSAIF